MFRPFVCLAVLVCAAVLTGCGASHRLGEYEFADRSVAVVAAIPPGPRVMSGPWSEAFVDLRDPVGTAVRIGTATAKWEQARKAQARLDSAAARVDVAEVVARAALINSAQTLGYRPVDRPADADYVLDIRLYDYGLVADSYDGATYFAMEADVVLLDRAGEGIIWEERLRAREVVTDALFGLPAAAGNVVTARALARLSVEEMTRGLERLAAYAADRVTAELRDDYLDSRR
ncbi:MAG: hypothetical protein R3362_01550 [Rhodothermales bacterium]|nr:hypothetical protein [Rhodothermales bacterium]